MKYEILAKYEDGDSFGQWDTELKIDLEWDTMEKAQENINRITEHYKFYQEIDKCNNNSQECTDLVRALNNERWGVSNNSNCIRLLTNEGKDYQMWAPWTGYFANFLSVKIVEHVEYEEEIHQSSESSSGNQEKENSNQ